MFPFRKCGSRGLLLCAAVSLGTAAVGQSPSPTAAVAFSKARALYYLPVDAGLEGFGCEVSFDWKTFIEKASNQPVPEDDSRLKYLRSIHLTVDDDLHGRGELHWTASAPPPQETEDSVTKVRDGFQQMWSGFFQTWNGFLTGDMVTLDARSTAEHTAEGYHVVAGSGPSLAEEQYDNKFLLQSVHVSTPTLDSLVYPSFASTPQGLLVSGIRSVYKQSPNPEPTEVLMKVNYAPVSAFQIPSEVMVTVGPANFDFHLVNCTVRTKLTQK